MSYVLQSKVGGNFKPHPEGIHPAVCVDLVELGLVETEWLGQRRLVNKLRLVFETEQRNEEGKNCIVGKTFTASLNPKAKLADFMGKWRGRPIVPGESIDLAKLIGACCTLVISHQQNLVGRTYASIDAVSKPTKKVVPSGHYDPALARQRIAEWSLRTATGAKEATANPNTEARNPREVRSPKSEREGAAAINPVAAAFSQAAGSGRLGEASLPGRASSPSGPTNPNSQLSPPQEFDPEVGF